MRRKNLLPTQLIDRFRPPVRFYLVKHTRHCLWTARAGIMRDVALDQPQWSNQSLKACLKAPSSWQDCILLARLHPADKTASCKLKLHRSALQRSSPASAHSRCLPANLQSSALRLRPAVVGRSMVRRGPDGRSFLSLLSSRSVG